MITTYAVSLTAEDCGDAERIALIDLVSDWLVAQYPVDSRPAGLSVRVSREASDDPVFRVSITESTPRSTHVETLTVTVALLGTNLSFDMRTVSTPTTSKVVPYRTAPIPPKRLVQLVCDVMKTVTVYDANRRVVETAARVDTSLGGQEVAAYMYAPNRQLPMVIEVADTVSRRPPVMAMGTGPLSGLVHMFMLATTAALDGFLEMSGHSIVNPGDIIIQWPGNSEPEIFHAREYPDASIPRERERLVRLIVDTAARSVASPRVPPPPRRELDMVEPSERDDATEPEIDGDSAVYIEQLESQVDELEAALADADRIIADQRSTIEKKSGEVDELVLQKVNLEIRAGSDSAAVLAVPSMKEALRIARERCQFLVFHERAIESGESLEGPEPVSVLQDLARLNEVARAWMSGEISGGSIKLACRQMGLDFAPDVSDNAKQKYEQDYVITWHGRTVVAGAHLRRGRKTHLVRIHVYFDTERQQVVVAYIGRHLRDKGSAS
ncbi:MAG: hypothetical protein RJA47_1526 [Actinomycetota bacterium]